MYNKIYFLHIMKTGGRFLQYDVLGPIRYELKRNNIAIIEESQQGDAHSGWHTKIDDDTYIITILRDSVEQAVSLYAHAKTTTINGEIKKEYDKKNITKENFFESMDTMSLFPNNQSRSFMHSEYDRFDSYKATKNVDTNLLSQRIDRVNLILDCKDLSNNDLIIQEKILKDLKIDGNTVKAPYHKQSFYNYESKKIFKRLSPDEKEHVRLINSIDDNLYKNANFWRPGH